MIGEESAARGVTAARRPGRLLRGAPCLGALALEPAGLPRSRPGGDKVYAIPPPNTRSSHNVGLLDS